MNTKHKTLVLNFTNSFKSCELWLSAFLYDIFILVINFRLSQKKLLIIKDTIYNGPAKPQSIPDLFPGNTSLFEIPQESKSLINIVLFDIIFTLIFYLYQRGKLKIFNASAVFAVAILMTILFIVFGGLIANT